MGITLILAVSVVLISIVSPPSQTLRDRARDGKPVTISVDCDCGEAPQLEELIARTDLIVRGTIVDAQSHLTSDEQGIETVYTLQPAEILAQRTPTVHKSPGVVPALRFVHPGGRVTIDGTPVEVVVGWLPEIPVGQEGLFFLKKGSQPDLLAVAESPFGTFEVHGSQIRPMGRAKEAYKGDMNQGLAHFSATVANLARVQWNRPDE